MMVRFNCVLKYICSDKSSFQFGVLLKVLSCGAAGISHRVS